VAVIATTELRGLNLIGNMRNNEKRQEIAVQWDNDIRCTSATSFIHRAEHPLHRLCSISSKHLLQKENTRTKIDHQVIIGRSLRCYNRKVEVNSHKTSLEMTKQSRPWSPQKDVVSSTVHYTSSSVKNYC
jgi:hypothetical protein